MTCQATFSSCSRLGLPEGIQSAPNAIGTPAARAAPMSVVSLYSRRLDCGDQTSFPPLPASWSKCSRLSAVPWIITVASLNSGEAVNLWYSLTEVSLVFCPSARWT